MSLIRITSNYFCAGVVAHDDVVTHAAPILKYMRGWTIKRVRAYCKIKDWDCEIKDWDCEVYDELGNKE